MKYSFFTYITLSGITIVYTALSCGICTCFRLQMKLIWKLRECVPCTGYTTWPCSRWWYSMKVTRLLVSYTTHIVGTSTMQSRPLTPVSS